MIKYAGFDVVFQEFPGEVTLAINLSRCPNRCKGCHSAALQGDIGEELTIDALDALVNRYRQAVTCVALMGGDGDAATVSLLLRHVRDAYGLRTGWYSGRTCLPNLPAMTDPQQRASTFNYIKLGPYIAARGPLNQSSTNQRFYKVETDGSLTDRTASFWKEATH